MPKNAQHYCKIPMALEMPVIENSLSMALRGGVNKLSHVTGKPVFEICDQVRLKPACAATEAS